MRRTRLECIDGCRQRKQSGRPDSNRGPPPPKGRALPGCATPRARPVLRRHPLGFAAVADVRPINALHYDLDTVGSLGDVAAPPYDVIDPSSGPSCSRARPTTRSRSTCRNRTARPGPQDTEGDPYERRAADDRGLARGGRPGRRPRAGDLGDDPGLHRPRRREPAPATASSAGSGSRTSTPARSCPTSAPCPGPKKDRLDLTRATRHNLSPIFSLSTEDPWPLVEPAIDPGSPWGEATDEGGTVTRVWRVGDPERARARSPSCSPAPSC